MASGVSVDPEVMTIFNDMKLNKNTLFVLFKLSEDKKKIIFESKTDKPKNMDYCEDNVKLNWGEFVQSLPENCCRYAVYDLGYTISEGGRRDKLLFVSWCPDVGSIKEKMVYASSKDALKKVLIGISSEVQANDKGDLEFNIIKEKLSRKTCA